MERETQEHIGIHQNQWQTPITEFGTDAPTWVEQMKQSPYVGDIDFGRKEWAMSRETVDAVMDLLLKGMRTEAKSYEGLRIDSYIRQGSSREGLKVIAPDEFDTMIEFHIEGLEDCVKQRNILKNGTHSVPGYFLMAIDGKTMEQLAAKYPKMHKADVFKETDGGHIYISSRSIHQKIFKSLIDKACSTLSEPGIGSNTTENTAPFEIKRKDNPPAINLTIHLDGDGQQPSIDEDQVKNVEIDLDIVPAMLLRHDKTTTYENEPLNCPIHAVCKWTVEDSTQALEFVDQSLVWVVKTTGYEKHVLDVARKSQRKLYILTALRIMKTYFRRTKEISKAPGHAPPPKVVTVLKSYHLKQIAFYLLLHLCHGKCSNLQIDGAHRALIFFINVMTSSLHKGRLPHFFYSNKDVQCMLPGFLSGNAEQLAYDLYRGFSNEDLEQALQSVVEHLFPHLGLIEMPSFYDMEIMRIRQAFTDNLNGLEFF